MDSNAKQQYMDTMRAAYRNANKKEKGVLLDEYCARVPESRKYVIKKFRYLVKIKKPHERKKRGVLYDGHVRAALVDVWNIFDHPCGQRLKPLLLSEVDRLRTLKELTCSDAVALHLKQISSATIDRALHHEKEVLLLKLKYTKKRELTLMSLVPVKTSSDLDRTKPGRVQIDCVEHCGASASGEYVNTLTTVDILFGWWEGDAFMGKSQLRTLAAIDATRKSSPLTWVEAHPDNGSNLLNWHMHAYAEAHQIALSRSRPYQKNDNCFVEQKNSTHVRKEFGYLRYDTLAELTIMQGLYRTELRLYKNFFQPVMKLTQKLRMKGKIHRKYDIPQTPYHRIMASADIDTKTKDALRRVYADLNPAQLKRTIDQKIKLLYAAYCKKQGTESVDVHKRQP